MIGRKAEINGVGGEIRRDGRRVYDPEAQGVSDSGGVRVPAASEEENSVWDQAGPAEERVFPTARS